MTLQVTITHTSPHADRALGVQLVDPVTRATLSAEEIVAAGRSATVFLWAGADLHLRELTAAETAAALEAKGVPDPHAPLALEPQS